MKAEYINPFVKAAASVLRDELGSEVGRGEIYLHRSAYTSQDVTVLIGVTGQVNGIVLYSLSKLTACNIAAHILDQPFPEFDDLAQSGVAEIGNVITGTAGIHLSEAGFTTNISPPTVLVGSGTMVSTIDLPRLVIPLTTMAGPIEIHVALQVMGSAVPNYS